MRRLRSRSLACHCTTCKKRTGSAYGAGLYFDEAPVRITAGEPTCHERTSATSGRWLRNEFCPRCGTTVSWTLEMRPGVRAVAGGSYDDATWFRIGTHIWTASACNGASFPADADVRAGPLIA